MEMDPLHAVLVTVILLYTLCSVLGQHCPRPCVCQGHFEVYCNRTGISTVPKGIPLETTLLDLGENRIRKIPTGSLAGLNNLNTLALYQSNFRGEEIEAGTLNLPNLTSIDLSSNRYMKIPRNLPPKMQSVYLEYNPIAVLDETSFAGYETLTTIDVSNCNISLIKPHTFDSLNSLTVLNIGFTPLTNKGIPDGVFAKSTKLTSIGFRFSHLTTPVPNLPPSIENLDYVGNPITVLPSYGFKSLSKMVVLEWFENKITTLEDNAFVGLSNLQILDFMDGKISSPITKSTFSGLTNLRTIYLSDNQIPKVEVGAFHDFRSLSQLWLGDNNITTLEEGVLDTKYMPNLSLLFLEFNPWYCDCHLRWLREKMDNASYVIQDPHLIVCHGPEKVAGKGWDVLKPEDFVC